MIDSRPRYNDRTQPLAGRIEDLLSQKPLDEKIAQLACLWGTILPTKSYRGTV